MKNKNYTIKVCLMAVLLFLANVVSAQNFERKAKSGNVQAQVELAKQYYSGIGQLQNYKQALVWFEKAAKGGNVDAMYQAATMREEGKGCEANIREAFNYYLKAAERGNIPSQIKVAMMYEQGQGTVKSEARAYLWYRVCADRDDILACRKVGDYYAEGNVVGKDHTEAKLWYEKALSAAGKDTSVMSFTNNDVVWNGQKINEAIIVLTNLAHLYTADEGLAPNPDKAEELLKEAKSLSALVEKAK
ncbi:MAG: sel1 repeat family protein [Bacteroidales bacterium]|jgi:TPR repeat protein|nr:sel1 repeat family protein [Bacteroidales bacterium]